MVILFPENSHHLCIKAIHLTNNIMKTKITLILLSLLISGMMMGQNTTKSMKNDQIPQEGRGSSKVAHLGRSIDQMIYEFMEKEGIPGLTLAIVQAPYIPRVVGYGTSDLEQNRLASSKTVWPAGPISQGFAAIAIMQLYENGKLDLQDKAGKYLKDLPAAWREITIFQLMQHATGIADYRQQAGYDASRAYTPSGLIATVADQPLAFAPGTDVAQSATNFLLLAEIVEKVSRMSYADFVNKYQIEKVGLRHTVFSEDLGRLKQEDVTQTNTLHELFKKDPAYIDPTENATGYKEVEGKLIRQPQIHSSALKGFADLWASSEDISTWDIALAGSVLIHKPENRDLVYKPTKLDNGKIVPAMAGWQFPRHKGFMDIKGSVPGFSSYLSRFTDASELVCVTFQANKEGVDFTNLAREVAAAFDNRLGAAANDNDLFTYESVYPVDETIARLENQLKALNIPVFAKFDHGRNAQEVNLPLRPTQVIVFGAPAVGTHLMQVNQSIAIELPLRIAVWEDENHSVWVAFPQMAPLAEKYNLSDSPIPGKMQTLLQNLVIHAASVY